MFLRTVVWTLAFGAVVVLSSIENQLQGQGKGKTPPIVGAASATGAISGSFSGAFDSAGNFSGSGTSISFDLSQELPLATGTGHGTPLGGTVIVDASFTTLSGAGGSLLAMSAGSEMVKSVRFGWANPAYQKGSSDPTGYGVHFRGNAVLDGVTEMSRLQVSCLADATDGCREWVLTPCLVADNAPCGGNDVSEVFDPAPPNGIGQLYGDFPNRFGGYQPIARYVMNWSMTLSR